MPWTSSAWLGHEPFAFWLVDALRPRQFVELGVHFGASYCAFCEAVASLELDTRCTGVDTWQGDEHAGTYSDVEFLPALRAYHDPLYHAFSTLQQSTFDDAAATFAPGSVDLLHIDGLHTYEAVRHDFETWQHALSDRAVVLFHDTAVLDRGFGVHQFWAEIAADRPNFLFHHAFGLGVLGYGTNLPEPLRALFAASEEEARDIRGVFEALGARAMAERRPIPVAQPPASRASGLNLPGWARAAMGLARS